MALRFGEFTLDEARRQIFRGAEPLHVSPKAFQLLGLLIAERPRALSKRELLEDLWPGTFVSEGNLPSLIAELRATLGDDARKPRYIRTLYGFGYSLAAEVVDTDAPTAVQAEPGAEVRRHRLRVASLIALIPIVLFAAGTLLMEKRRGGAEPAPPIRSIAVLPFDTPGATEGNAHLGSALTDLIITRLSNASVLSVRPTSTVRAYTGSDDDSREIGRALQVDGVLEGTVRASGDDIRVTVQMIDVRKGTPLWADQFEEKRAEMFALEDRIAAQVAAAVLLRLTPKERALLEKRHTSDPEAYRLYIEGRYHLQQWSSGSVSNMLTAREKFRRAIEKDPGYALAWADLAKACVGVSPPQFLPEAEAAARRALELDPSLHEAYVSLALVKMFWHLDYAGAERDFHRALAANPTDFEAIGWYGYLLQCLGRFDEALRMRLRQIELAPTDAIPRWGLANVYLTSRRYDLARETVRKVLAMKPDYPEANVGMVRVLLAEQRYDEAIQLAEKLVESDPRSRPLSFLGYALALAGREAEARQALERLYAWAETGPVSPFDMANIHVALGEYDRAFALLETCVEKRDYVIRLKTEPTLDPLRSDPRFHELLIRGGFDTP